MNRKELRLIAYREAAAMLSVDADKAELQCEQECTEREEEIVRAFIRDEIVTLLEKRGKVGMDETAL